MQRISKHFFVGQPIAYVENDNHGYLPYYASSHIFDTIISKKEKGYVKTEKGLTLKIFDDELKFTGKFPKNGKMVNIMYGKEMPHNLGNYYRKTPIFKYSIWTFESGDEANTYLDKMMLDHANDLREAKARAFDLEQQKALEAEALKEYTELVAKNDLVRDEFLKEEQALKQQLILKHCKDIDKHVWSDGTITYYCRRW